MAIRYAVASGNWSSTATWDGGTTIPGSGDDVYANNFTVSINQTITVKSLKKISNASPVIAAGGTFDISASVTVTITDGISAGDNTTNSSALLQSSGASLTITVNANIVAGAGTGRYGLRFLTTSSGTATVNGNVTGGSGTGSHALLIEGSASKTFTVNGNVTGGTGSSAVGIRLNASAAEMTVVGAITGGSAANYGVDVAAGKLRIDAAMRYGTTGCAPVHCSVNPPVFVRDGASLAMVAPSDDDWPALTGDEIYLTEGGAAARYTLAVGDSAVTPG